MRTTPRFPILSDMKPRKPIPRSTKPLKRSPLKRGTKPLPKGKPPKRGKPPRKVNLKRKAARFERDYGGKDYVAWLTSQPCVISGRRHGEKILDIGNGYWTQTSIQAVHVRSRGAGGRADDQVPMDWWLHRDQHITGIRSFCAKHGTTVAALREKARAYRSQWEALHA